MTGEDWNAEVTGKYIRYWEHGGHIYPVLGTDPDGRVKFVVGLEAFKWGYSGHIYLIDRDGPTDGLWAFVEAAHRAGWAAYDASRNEWDWELGD